MIRQVSFRELDEALCNNNELFGATAFSDEGWKEKEGGYSLKERTYIFSGDNKAFGDYAGYSCFASDLAGVDICIRLERYWMDWEKIVCWIMDKESIPKFKDMIDIMDIVKAYL